MRRRRLNPRKRGRIAGQIQMITLTKPVRRITRRPFFTYGPDRDRLFVASLEPGDVLTLRPLRSRQSSGAVASIGLADIYRYALLCRVRAANLEKAQAIKKKKAAARETRRLAREVAA